MSTVSLESVLCILHFLDPGSAGFPYPCGCLHSMLSTYLSPRLSIIFGTYFYEPAVSHLEIFTLMCSCCSC